MDIGLGNLGTTLDSRYLESDRPVLLSGIQALVRLLLEQARQDRRDGLRTAGLVSGYRVRRSAGSTRNCGSGQSSCRRMTSASSPA